MDLNNEVIRKLRDALPIGYGKVIRERLLAKGDDFTVTYIYYVINPDCKRRNETIINEAISYLKEVNSIKAEKEAEILALTEDICVCSKKL